MTASKLFDVLIIGGGPAGLSIASALARQVYTAVVFDSGAYRNAVAQHMHTVPGFDHENPADYRAKIRADLQKRYETIEFQAVTVTRVKKLESGIFEAEDEKGQVYRGKKLGLAAGVRDVIEGEVAGFEECWGRSVFHCLFCHGFEERGVESAGTLATGFLNTPQALSHLTLFTKRLSKRVTVYTNGNNSLAEQTRPLLHSSSSSSSKISFDTRTISKLTHLPGKNDEDDDRPEGVLMTFADGTTKTEGFIASHPLVEHRAGRFTEQLGLELTPAGDIKVEGPFNETSVEGCFAAGDAATGMRNVVQAVQMGVFAGIGMVSQLAKGLEKKGEL